MQAAAPVNAPFTIRKLYEKPQRIANFAVVKISLRACQGGSAKAVSNVQISDLTIDLPTLCVVAFFITVVAGLLLVFSWLQNRRAPSLALWGLGYLLGAMGPGILALRGFMPLTWSMIAAGTSLCLAYGVLWSGARTFEGRSIRLPLVFGGGMIWLAACQFDVFRASEPARVVLLSIVTAAYTLLAAREVWYGRDRELVSRWPTLALLLVHAGFLLARIPFARNIGFPPAADGLHRVALVVVVLEALFAVFCMAFLRVNMSKERAELEQRRAALTDWLTGVANRRAFFDRGEALLTRNAAERRSAALVLFDIDHFKEVNDTAGHQAGDAVLKTFAELVASAMRADDLFGRLGGEEFACLLPKTSMAETLQVSERIRRGFAATHFPGLENNVTVSVGIAMAGEADRDLQTLLATADRALYRAKADGRNRVAPAPPMLVDAGRVIARLPPHIVRGFVA
jgi:diguanylate cyclase (GGDEF)-like protein